MSETTGDTRVRVVVHSREYCRLYSRADGEGGYYGDCGGGGAAYRLFVGGVESSTCVLKPSPDLRSKGYQG